MELCSQSCSSGQLSVHSFAQQGVLVGGRRAVRYVQQGVLVGQCWRWTCTVLCSKGYWLVSVGGGRVQFCAARGIGWSVLEVDVQSV